MSISYIKKKRAEIDNCNICGTYGKMTWDHVPPKAAYNETSAKVNTAFSGMPEENAYQKKYQNGIKFRSVCQKCNNELLSQYDTVYANFINKVASILDGGDISNLNIEIEEDVRLLCKGIIGHFLSAKDFYDEECTVDIALRKYLLFDELSPELKIYYWIYPYKTINIIRDVVTGNVLGERFPKGMISVIASFPIAFMIAMDDDAKTLPDLLDYQGTNRIPIDIRTMINPATQKMRDYLWPCNIGDEKDDASFVLAGSAGAESSRIGIHEIEI